MQRHLIYNCAPLELGAAIWRDNVKWLCKYKDTFNGQKLIIVRTGSGMESLDTVKTEFNMDAEFLERPNDPYLWEQANFIEVLGRLETQSTHEAIFYAHTKGVSHVEGFRPDIPKVLEHLPWRGWEYHKVAIRQWRNRMYHECLHDPEKIDNILEKYAACGCFFLEALPNNPIGAGWMFGGTFYWMKSNRIFSRTNWKQIGKTRMGPERYLSVMFSRKEVFVLRAKVPNLAFENVIGCYSCEYCGEFEAKVTESVLCPKCKRDVGCYIALPSIGQ